MNWPSHASAGCLALLLSLGISSRTHAAKTLSTPPNIILVLVDQECFELPKANGYTLPARDRLARHGITFTNHYIASAMCTPSRAALLTGQPPQRNGVIDQLEYSWQDSLSTKFPTMGSALRTLGYKTAYFGKFERSKPRLAYDKSVNYTHAIRDYGWDTFAANGDTGSQKDSGYQNDRYTAGEAVKWIRTHTLGATAAQGREPRNNPLPQASDQPFFLVASFVNPHDVMWIDTNLPGEHVQIPARQGKINLPPDNSLYRKQWHAALPASLSADLDDPQFPRALAEYRKGWSDGLGWIPQDRTDMWQRFTDYYLNVIRDSDSALAILLDAVDELGLWDNTIIIFTADHGEMDGHHGGLRGKGPFAYEQNVHVPMIIASPGVPGGGRSALLTSHLDLLPTMAGMTGMTDAAKRAGVAALPGRDFSGLLRETSHEEMHALRPGILFNYVGPFTVDAGLCTSCLASAATDPMQPQIGYLVPSLGKRGFVAAVFDGRYKFARYYAPNDFNTPATLDELFAHNDVQLFDLQNDPQETKNLAMDRKANAQTLERMNTLTNELMAREVGVNDGRFLPAPIRPIK